ncbi:MAG: hypothetical protein WCG63_04210 [Opitutaceae bacterium]
MNCGIFIVARLGSQRLQAKHLQPAASVPVLLHLIRRLRHTFSAQLADGRARIVIATSDEPANRTFEEVVGTEASVFYGSIHNIPLRQLQAAEAVGCSEIVSVDGDDILCSPTGVLAVAEKLAGGASYAQTSGLPFGINSFGYTRRFLTEAMAGHQQGTLETGWGRIFQGKAPATISYAHMPQDERLRFTLDYPADLEFFRALLEALGPQAPAATDEEIVRLVLDRQFYLHNGALAEEYWANFRRQLEIEKKSNS